MLSDVRNFNQTFFSDIVQGILAQAVVKIYGKSNAIYRQGLKTSLKSIRIKTNKKRKNRYDYI